VLPVVALDDASVAPDLCRALLAGGISVVEITFRTSAAAAAIERAVEVEGMVVGAGTVLTAGQAQAAAEAGAVFAVAPGTDDEVVAASGELGLPFFPGIATPSELGHVLRLGCSAVKVFPASTLGGPAFLRALSATFPQARFLPNPGDRRRVARLVPHPPRRDRLRRQLDLRPAVDPRAGLRRDRAPRPGREAS
jgi:2-dehydro-3-deoxyphosphogluconate aldolase/(4S)-4-hydroxy-2-oxoglutarate aldolase